MTLREWGERYRTSDDQVAAVPVRLVNEVCSDLSPGYAVDLACGSGRNALWLAARGWSVTAVDGAPYALEILRQRADAAGVSVRTVQADLEHGEFVLTSDTYDLVLMSYYLQRDLLESAKAAVRPGGLLIAIVHTTRPDEEPNYKRAQAGELATFFDSWEIVHHYEGPSRDPEHKRPVAEIIARRPLTGPRSPVRQ